MLQNERLEKLIELFRKHIGMGKALTKYEIFEHIFGELENYSDEQIFVLWDKLRKDMNLIRRTYKKHNCFIVFTKEEVEDENGIYFQYKFFVPKNRIEALEYRERMRKNIESCKFMSKVCKTYVDKQMWKLFEE